MDANQKPTIQEGVIDVTTDKDRNDKITWMQVQQPFDPPSEVKFRKTAGGIAGGKFVVECSGGCESIEYIKLSKDVKEGQVPSPHLLVYLFGE